MRTTLVTKDGKFRIQIAAGGYELSIMPRVRAYRGASLPKCPTAMHVYVARSWTTEVHVECVT